MSADKGGRGVWKISTNDEKEGKEGQQNHDICRVVEVENVI